jgi:hypothetical protein
MDIHETCVENDISISSQWIPRESNTEADSLSRMNDCDDWGIQTRAFMLLEKEWGSHTLTPAFCTSSLIWSLKRIPTKQKFSNNKYRIHGSKRKARKLNFILELHTIQ